MITNFNDFEKDPLEEYLPKLKNYNPSTFDKMLLEMKDEDFDDEFLNENRKTLENFGLELISQREKMQKLTDRIDSLRQDVNEIKKDISEIKDVLKRNDLK